MRTELSAAVDDLLRLTPKFTYWSSLSSTLKSGTAKAAYTIPIATYLILYSEYLSKWLLLDPNSTGAGLITPIWRSNLLYFGGCSLLLSFAFFLFFCPWVIRLYPNRSAFIATTTTTRDFSSISKALAELVPVYASLKLDTYDAGAMNPRDKKLFDLVWAIGSDFDNFAHVYSDAHTRPVPDNTPWSLHDASGHTYTPMHLSFFYNRNDRSKPTIRYIVFVIAAFGYACLAVPAFDMFWRVIRKIIGV